MNLGKQHFPRYLDYLWKASDTEQTLIPPLIPQPIELQITSTKVYLNPKGELPADAGNIQINAQSQHTDLDTGLIVFDLASSGEITNHSGVVLKLEVTLGALRAEDWQDVYVLLSYKITT